KRTCVTPAARLRAAAFAPLELRRAKRRYGAAAFARFARVCRLAGLPSRSSRSERRLVPQDRIELSTYPLPRGCATTTLLRQPGSKCVTCGTAAIDERSERRKRIADARREQPP